MPQPTVPELPITDCPDGAGSIHNPANPGGGFPGGNLPGSIVAPNPYVPPDACIGDLRLSQGVCGILESDYQNSLAEENLAISGAWLNIFKLLGVHEQGKLVDLTGDGHAISSSGDPSVVFDAFAGSWTSEETGTAVVLTPTWVGYDFGVRKTSYGQDENAPGVPAAQHITSFRITQGSPVTVRQVRIDRSNGGYKVNPAAIEYTGTGTGTMGGFKVGYASRPGMFMVEALDSTRFTVMYVEPTGSSILGLATVGTQFNSGAGSFTITAGAVPFAAGDMFTAPVELDWYRVDVVNLPSVPTAAISIKQSSASRYWRLVPLIFTGAAGEGWTVDKLELFDFQATNLDNIQDTLFMENRDRDYANTSIPLQAVYQPFDGMSDLTKFGFQVPDVYTFTLSYASMIRTLGRPIVVGDIIEVPAEAQYDHNLRLVRKFLEVSDVGWSAEGYTTGWRAIMYRISAQQLIPSQEHRDLLGTVDTQKYVVDDGSFFNDIHKQIQTDTLTVTEANQADAEQAVPEKGTNVREYSSGTDRFKAPGSYDGRGPYVEDGLPPDGLPYTQGFTLPDVAGVTDGAFFRLEYPIDMNIPARLYKFSGVKNKWIWTETDRRGSRSAHKPSEQVIFNLADKRSLTDPKV